MSHTSGPERAAAAPPEPVPSDDTRASAGSRSAAVEDGATGPGSVELVPPPGPRAPVMGGDDVPVPVPVALATLLVAGLLAVAAASSPQLLAVALGACTAVVAWGWAGTLGLPTPRGTVGVVLLGGLALVLSVVARDVEPWLGWVPAALALAMIAAFAHQLFRRDGRPRVVESVSSVVLALALVACGVLLVPMSHTAEGVALVLGALAAAAATALSDLLGRVPALRAWLTPVALLAGGGAAVLVAVVLDRPLATWLLLGVVAGALSHAVRRILRPLPTLVHPRPQLVAAVVSVLVVGLVPFLVALAFGSSAFPG